MNTIEKTFTTRKEMSDFLTANEICIVDISGLSLIYAEIPQSDIASENTLNIKGHAFKVVKKKSGTTEYYFDGTKVSKTKYDEELKKIYDNLPATIN